MSSFNLSADAPEFVPRVAVVPAADPTKTLTIDTKSAAGDRKRTLTMRPMAEPRTKSLIEGLGPFNMIGVMVRGSGGHGDEDDISSLPDMGEDILPAGAVEVMDGCHNNDYRLKTIQRSILGIEDVDVGDFPKNITEYYWINDGKRDEYPWYVLGGLGNGAYFYYTASCTFSGFECAGGMALYAAKDLQTLYDHGMNEAARLRFASCFDKGTREKLKADAAAARASHQAYIASQKQARAAAAAARSAKPKPQGFATSYLATKARMEAGAAALQASFAAGRAAGVSASKSGQRIARGPSGGGFKK